MQQTALLDSEFCFHNEDEADQDHEQGKELAHRPFTAEEVDVGNFRFAEFFHRDSEDCIKNEEQTSQDSIGELWKLQADNEKDKEE